MTQSRGSFTFHFVRYEDCPAGSRRRPSRRRRRSGGGGEVRKRQSASLRRESGVQVFAGGKILKSAEFTSGDLHPMRGPGGRKAACGATAPGSPGEGHRGGEGAPGGGGEVRKRQSASPPGVRRTSIFCRRQNLNRPNSLRAICINGPRRVQSGLRGDCPPAAQGEGHRGGEGAPGGGGKITHICKNQKRRGSKLPAVSVSRNATSC